MIGADVALTHTNLARGHVGQKRKRYGTESLAGGSVFFACGATGSCGADNAQPEGRRNRVALPPGAGDHTGNTDVAGEILARRPEIDDVGEAVHDTATIPNVSRDATQNVSDVMRDDLYRSQAMHTVATDNPPSNTPAERLRMALMWRGLIDDPPAAAELLGVSQRTLRSHLNGNRGITRDRALIYAERLKVSAAWLLTGESPARDFAGPPPDAFALKPSRVATLDRPASGVRDPRHTLPVYASAQGGDDGALIMSSEPIEWIERPESLQNVRAAFGVYITGDSMEPAFHAGNIAVIDPARPVTRGKNVLLVGRGANNEQVALLKILEGETSTHWKVRQLNPARYFTLAKADWPYCYLVRLQEYR